MTSAANQDAYGPRGWNQGPWGNSQGPSWQRPNNGPNAGNPTWGDKSWGDRSWGNNPGGNPPWGYDQWGGPPFWHPAGLSRPAAIAFTVLGFIFWWPVGLALLIYLIGSGRMGCFGRRRRAMYQQYGQDAGPWANWKAWACGPSDRPASTSGNRAFDEYKAETLRRMEEEQKDFGAFLDRLRFAKDKSEFDQFMAERRNRPPAPPTDEQPAA
ncbi:MAG TPA: DUF2852 domain-containing protein [Rhodopila sp.]|jgi:hypothetical protein|nr:DUF2852 domain-containing protein [Rhodopila sp.]